MGIAGGLSALSKIPACNLLVLGKVGKGGDTGGLFAKGQVMNRFSSRLLFIHKRLHRLYS